MLQEFKNADGDEYHADLSTLASPASQGGPDVYILPLTEVSLPTAKQPARSGESTQESVFCYLLTCYINCYLLDYSTKLLLCDH